MKTAVNPFFKEALAVCNIPLQVSNLGKDIVELSEADFWMVYHRVKAELSKALLFFEVGTSAVLHFRLLADDSDLFFHIHAKDLELLKTMVREAE